jgi:putative DNA primase/helicase
MTPEHSNGNNGTLLSLAKDLVSAGLSFVPVRVDGSKQPAWDVLPLVYDEREGRDKPKWDPFKQRLPTDAELHRWFAGPPRGLGIICGGISGGLELLDFDVQADVIFPRWCELVEAAAPGLVNRLCVAKTPNGYHVRYRVPDIEVPGNQKLAEDPDLEKPTLIETRGEGGYGLAPGCPPECHPTRKTYEQYSGPGLADVPSLSIDEREVLIRVARSFDRRPPAPPDNAPPTNTSTNHEGASGLRPGEDFNRRGTDWAQLLEPKGWRCVGGSGERRLWLRPGKKGPGLSATTGHCRNESGELFYPFTSNAPPFQADRPYNRFAVYTLLYHNGDFSAAAKTLAAEGYGEQRRRPAAGRAGGEPTAAPKAVGCLRNFDLKKVTRGGKEETVKVGRASAQIAADVVAAS